MKYVSTSGNHTTDLRGALLQSIAPDGTLYLPESIPVIPKALFNNIEAMKLQEIAYVVASTLLGTDIALPVLKKIVDATFTFPFPLKTIRNGLEILELFDGPTLAFKDISARFLAQLFKEFPASATGRRVVIAVTTGNTGAAIANAFASVKDVDVLILYPHGTLTRNELLQFTTVGNNIHAIEVNGTIGQCRALAREAVSDTSLPPELMPVLVNTSNILRIIPQVVFYFYAYARLKKRYGASADGFTAAIPCGSLSSLTAAVIAKRLGLPMGRIVAGTNANDDIARLLSGEINMNSVHISSRPTIAKAMDSGYPTNVGRIVALYGRSREAANADISSLSMSDAEIADIIREELVRSRYILDPHTATAMGALNASGIEVSAFRPAVVLATAHPAKSLDIMTQITGRAIELPLQLTRFMGKGSTPAKIPPTYAALKKYILNNLTKQ